MSLIRLPSVTHELLGSNQSRGAWPYFKGHCVEVSCTLLLFREWYSYHFPELIRIVPDNHLYAKVGITPSDLLLY